MDKQFTENKKRVKLRDLPTTDPGHTVWEVLWDSKLIGTVARTNDDSLDNYRWEWILADGITSRGTRASGVVELRSEAVSALVWAGAGEVVWY